MSGRTYIDFIGDGLVVSGQHRETHSKLEFKDGDTTLAILTKDAGLVDALVKAFEEYKAKSAIVPEIPVIDISNIDPDRPF